MHALKTIKGLTAQEVLASREKYGINLLTPPVREPWWKLYLEKYDDPIIRILLIAASVAFLVGFAHNEYIEAIGIVIAIFLATTMAFINEYKAGKEFDILNKVNDDVEFKVIRDGNFQCVPKWGLVVGDIFLLETGEEVPADAEVLEAVSLRIDESTLTGESKAVSKFTLDDPKCSTEKASQTAYPLNQVYRGTMVQDGHGLFVIKNVGDATEIGRAAKEASEESGAVTPLNRQLEGLSKIIGVVGFGIAALLFVALSIHASVSGEIVLTKEQWLFTMIIIFSVLIALIRVWLPIVYDFFDVVHVPQQRPVWLEKEGLMPWVRTLLYGFAFFLVGSGFGWGMGFFSPSFDVLIDSTVARK